METNNRITTSFSCAFVCMSVHLWCYLNPLMNISVEEISLFLLPLDTRNKQKKRTNKPTKAIKPFDEPLKTQCLMMYDYLCWWQQLRTFSMWHVANTHITAQNTHIQAPSTFISKFHSMRSCQFLCLKATTFKQRNEKIISSITWANIFHGFCFLCRNQELFPFFCCCCWFFHI